MQVRPRTRRNYAGIEAFQISSSAGKKVAAVLFILSLFSCSLLEKKKYVGDIYDLCFSGEGRGRIEAEVEGRKRRYLFNYESKLERGRFSLGVSLPMQDDEILIIDLPPNMHFRGSFYRRLVAQQEGQDLPQLRAGLGQMGAFLARWQQRRGFTSGDWRVEKGHRGITVSGSVSGGGRFDLEAFDFQKGHFRRQEITFWDRANKKSFVLSLFVTDCSS